MAANNVLIWLHTFRNQRYLAHSACIIFGLILLVASMICFASSGMQNDSEDDKDHEQNLRAITAWAAAGAGAIGAWGSFYLLKTFQTIEREDATIMEEQANTNTTIITIIGGIFHVSMVVGTIFIDIAAIKYGYGGLAAISILYLFVLTATTCYDVLNLVRPGRIILLGQSSAFSDEHGVMD